MLTGGTISVSVSLSLSLAAAALTACPVVMGTSSSCILLLPIKCTRIYNCSKYSIGKGIRYKMYHSQLESFRAIDEYSSSNQTRTIKELDWAYYWKASGDNSDGYLSIHTLIHQGTKDNICIGVYCLINHLSSSVNLEGTATGSGGRGG